MAKSFFVHIEWAKLFYVPFNHLLLPFPGYGTEQNHRNRIQVLDDGFGSRFGVSDGNHFEGLH